MNTKQTIMFLLIIAIVILTPANAMTTEITDEYIIGFYGPSDKASIQQVEGEIVKEFNLINAVVSKMSPQAVSSLANRPNVKYIESNQKVFVLGQTVPWGIDRVFANEDYTFSTWNKSKGEGVAVAVLDTGINEGHEDLPKLSGGINIIDDTPWDRDDHGHGTAVSGVIAAIDNDIGVVGVAPKADLYSVKVLNEDGSGYISSIIEGIEWAVEQGIPIINISLGTSYDLNSLKEASDEAYSRGHLLIAAAGNEGNTSGDGNKVVYPARYESVIAVAASNDGDLKADFSSTGEDVELIAPGKDILTTTSEDAYNFWSGTSFSAPHVAGSAVLAWSTDLSLNNIQLRELLQETAEDLGLDKNYQGFGLVRPDKLISKLGKTGKLMVEDFNVPDEVEKEENIEISADIVNTGDIDLSQDIKFKVDGKVEENREDFIVEAGVSRDISFSYTIPEVQEKYIEVEIATEDDNESAVIAVLKSAYFKVSIDNYPKEVTGEKAEIKAEYTIENTGDVEDVQNIIFSVDDEIEDTEDNVMLGAGDTYSGEFIYITKSDDVGEEIGLKVFSDDESKICQVKILEAKGLNDPFELAFKVKDLANQDFVGEARIEVIFKTLSGEEEFHEFEEVEFFDSAGTISWMVGTEYGNDIVLEELKPKDINEITVKADEAEDTVSGFKE